MNYWNNAVRSSHFLSKVQSKSREKARLQGKEKPGGISRFIFSRFDKAYLTVGDR